MDTPNARWLGINKLIAGPRKLKAPIKVPWDRARVLPSSPYTQNRQGKREGPREKKKKKKKK